MNVVTLGVRVVDVLVRPVERIPEGQGGTLVEQIRITPARAGRRHRDHPGQARRHRPHRRCDRHRRARRCDARPAGPAWRRLFSARASRRGSDLGQPAADPARWLTPGLPRDRRQRHLLVGRRAVGGDRGGGLPAPRRARVHGRGGGREDPVLRPRERCGHLGDILAPGEQAAAILAWIAPAFGHLDYLLPNQEQVLALSGEPELAAGCRALLEHGVGCVAATCGGDGALVVDAGSAAAVPAFAVGVVDTTGCGDAFSAGFLRGISLGRAHREAALLGCAAASLVAQGLGSDHGEFDLAAADALINNSNKAVSG